jgi:hypothetical protein
MERRSCAVSGVPQPVEPDLDHGNFRIDLTDTELPARMSCLVLLRHAE